MVRSNLIPPPPREVAESADTEALQAHIHDLQNALLTLPVIEHAKGVVMLEFRVDADTAFAVLSRVSRDTNLKVREVAALVCEVCCGHQRPDPSTDPVLAHVLDQLAPAPPTSEEAADSSRLLPAGRACLRPCAQAGHVESSAVVPGR